MICFSRGVLHVSIGALWIPWPFLFLPHVTLSLEQAASAFLVRQVFRKPLILSLWSCREIDSAASSSSHFRRMLLIVFSPSPVCFVAKQAAHSLNRYMFSFLHNLKCYLPMPSHIAAINISVLAWLCTGSQKKTHVMNWLSLKRQKSVCMCF